MKVYALDGSVADEIALPAVFATEYRPDLIQRAVLTAQARARQPYGTDPLAGKRTSAHFHGVRRQFYSMQNREMARATRVHGSNPVQEFRARFNPQARSGRAPHPPLVIKVWARKINDKERRLAIKSAIAATARPELVASRHRLPPLELPIFVDDGIQAISKTAQLQKVLIALGLGAELERAAEKKIRPGRGKARGRRYKSRKSLLLVVADDKGISKASRNIPGVDVTSPAALSAELLAPGGKAGRLTIWSKAAVEQLDRLFV